MPVTAARVNEVEIRVRNLDPRHDGVRIAQLSDIHVGNMTPRSHVRAAIAAANGVLSVAARNLGLHRTQLYRLMDKLGIARE